MLGQPLGGNDHCSAASSAQTGRLKAGHRMSVSIWLKPAPSDRSDSWLAFSARHQSPPCALTARAIDAFVARQRGCPSWRHRFEPDGHGGWRRRAWLIVGGRDLSLQRSAPDFKSGLQLRALSAVALASVRRSLTRRPTPPSASARSRPCRGRRATPCHRWRRHRPRVSRAVTSASTCPSGIEPWDRSSGIPSRPCRATGWRA